MTNGKFFHVDSFSLGTRTRQDVSLIPKNPKYTSRAISLAKIMTTDAGEEIVKEHITIAVDNIDKTIEGILKAKTLALAEQSVVTA